MEAEAFDTELFIDEVEKRRCIWDTECPDYKNRVLKKSAWQEIVDVFAEKNMTKEEKTLLDIFFSGNTLQKKWKHVRDNYSRELKKQETLKSGSGASKSNPYIYFQRLQFLQPIVTNKAVTDSLENSNELDDETELLHSQPRSDEPQTRAVDKNVNSNKRFKINPVDKQFIDILNKSVALREQRHAEVPNKDDDDKLFCMSLYTELQKVPAHGRLRTKIQLLEVIQRAQEFYNPSQIPQVPPSYYSSYPPPQTFNQMNYGSNVQRHQFQTVQESSSSGLLMGYSSQSAPMSPTPSVASTALSPTDSTISQANTDFSDIYD
ncbi:uncharacterized protein [Parasteatoda tepidariorum]|uniref:uncharacterized protein n=1 Tax=Parasteatoda tepidariorum TaxID=114398 RepID=UPI0039BD84B0